MRRLLLLLTISCFFIGCGEVRYRHEVEEPGTATNWTYGEGNFIRYDGYNIGELSVAGDLEVSVTDYRRRDSNIVIKMVGVVHIGDRGYYRQIQEILDESDLVLYEGVNREGEPGTVDPKTKAHWDTMSSLFGFSAQTSNIHYDREHFRQCDLITDPEFRGIAGMGAVNEEMVELLKQLADAKQQVKMLFPEMVRLEDSIKHSNAAAFIASNGNPYDGMLEMIRELKVIAEPLVMLGEEYAEFYAQLEALEEQVDAINDLIIEDRNAYVMVKLAEIVGRMDNGGVISVFYGVGHMPDFDGRMKYLGFRRGKTTWLKAWSMNSR